MVRLKKYMLKFPKGEDKLAKGIEKQQKNKRRSGNQNQGKHVFLEGKSGQAGWSLPNSISWN